MVIRMKQAILSLDQGTTSTRAIVFSLEGEIISSSQIEHKQIYPQHSWVEHDAEEIWQNTLRVCKRALEEASTQGYMPVTMGITNQRETIIAWDKTTGTPLHNAIVWQDKRTAGNCEELRKHHDHTIQCKTGLPTDPYFSASKMQWLIEHIPAIQEALDAENIAFGTIDSFLLFKLTGGEVHATDITNASRTMLFNIHKCAWDAELMHLFEIPHHTLPKVLASAANFGITAANLLPVQLPIEGIAGDQQAATIGQCCFAEGMIKSTYGTGCFAVLNTGKTPVTSENGLITTILYQINDEVYYGLEGSIFIAGAIVQWLRDQLGLIVSAQETEQLAASASDDDDVYFVPAFTGLGAPYWDAEAKAAISGMTLDTNKDHIVRAALDAVAYQTNDLIQAMEKDTGQKIDHLRVDGGMVANNWLLSRIADILGIEIIRPHIIETTALGAAYLAGLHHGLYDSLEEVAQKWRCDQTFTSKMDSETRADKQAGWQKATQKVQKNA